MNKAERPIARIIERTNGCGEGFHWNLRANSVFDKLRTCRTEVLGERVMVCENSECLHSHVQYASCKNSYCESCNNLNRAKWLEKQFNDILPNTTYKFLTYKIPNTLVWVFQNNQNLAQKLIFRSMSEAMNEACQQKFGEGKVGALQFLHTWNQKLLLDYHLHVVVPCGLLKGEEWLSGSKYEIPFEVIRGLFRTKLINGLIKLYKLGELNLGVCYPDCIDVESLRTMLNGLDARKWKMHIASVKEKKGVERVKAYLGKTLFSLPITSSRIEAIDEKKNEVKYKYRLKSNKKDFGVMTLKFTEFLRRLSLHIQPKYFRRVRHFGFLSYNIKTANLKVIFKQLGFEYNEKKNKEIQSMKALEFIEKYTDWEIPCCPECGGRLISKEDYCIKYSIPPDQECLSFMAA